jgi:hypothetical protein
MVRGVALRRAIRTAALVKLLLAKPTGDPDMSRSKRPQRSKVYVYNCRRSGCNRQAPFAQEQVPPPDCAVDGHGPMKLGKPK